MRKFISVALLAQFIATTSATADSNNSTINENTTRAQIYGFATHHNVTDHDILYSGIMANTGPNQTDTTTNAFCSIRSDLQYLSANTLNSSSSCSPALLLGGGLDRSLQLKVEIGNLVYNESSGKHKIFHRNKTETQKNVNKKRNEKFKEIEDEIEKLSLRNKNVTQAVKNYTLFGNYRKLEGTPAQEGMPQWILNMTSVDYGNMS